MFTSLSYSLRNLQISEIDSCPLYSQHKLPLIYEHRCKTNQQMGAKICSLKIELQPQRGSWQLSLPAAGNYVSVIIWNRSTEFKRVSRAKALNRILSFKGFLHFFSSTLDQQMPFLLITAVTMTTAVLWLAPTEGCDNSQITFIQSLCSGMIFFKSSRHTFKVAENLKAQKWRWQCKKTKQKQKNLSGFSTAHWPEAAWMGWWSVTRLKAVCGDLQRDKKKHCLIVPNDNME